jgi:hypothetical protein
MHSDDIFVFIYGLSSIQSQIVFLNPSVSLGDFPPMQNIAALRSFDDFNKPYASHCREVLSAVCRAEYVKVEGLLMRFWSAVAPHFKAMVCDRLITLYIICIYIYMMRIITF